MREIEEDLNRNFSTICDWFVNNKLSIHFGESKTKNILFGTKNKPKKVGSLDITLHMVWYTSSSITQ